MECFISASSQKTAAAAKSSAAEKQHHTPPKFTRHRKAQAIAARKKTDGKKTGFTEVQRTCDFGSITKNNLNLSNQVTENNLLKLETYEFSDSILRELSSENAIYFCLLLASLQEATVLFYFNQSVS